MELSGAGYSVGLEPANCTAAIEVLFEPWSDGVRWVVGWKR
jgi:hypothetical protein